MKDLLESMSPDVPEVFIFPVTSNFSEGFVTPIPTLFRKLILPSVPSVSATE